MQANRLLVTGGSGFIGTNLVDEALRWGWELANLDTAPPLNEAHRPYWHRGGLMDSGKMVEVVDSFEPTHVVHLAARTDCIESVGVEAYEVNYTGTERLLQVLADCNSVQRAIFASTQFVIGPQHTAASLNDYAPHTAYGQSKVLAEKAVHEANPNYTWTIVRPVNIWGPWNERYSREAWRVIDAGLYLHPSGKPVVRTYGYVKNVVWQFKRIFELPPSKVSGATLYVGDRPVDIYRWVNAFSKALRGRDARRVPRSLIGAIALFGSAIQAIGVTFPITLSRFRSMTEDYPAPLDPTIELLGEAPYSLQDGVMETVEWLRSHQWSNGGPC